MKRTGSLAHTMRMLLATSLILGSSITVLVLANGPMGSSAFPANAQTQQPFDFGVFGDMGYALDQEPMVDNLLAELNGRQLEFVANVGDFGGPSTGSCTDEHRSRRLAQFQASIHPVIYTPGDNDWTDCWEERAGSYDALERLGSLRDAFFAGEQSLGRRTVPLIRQSADADYAALRENARWSHGGLTFLTLHYVSEVLGRTSETDAEFAERDAANVAWLRHGFLAARMSGSQGLVILTQANPFPTYAGGRGVAPEPRPGFSDFWGVLEEDTRAFGKPVLLIHGDTHFFRVDHPLHSSAPVCQAGTHDVRPIDCRLHNLTRVEGFGAPYHHWVQVTVDPADPALFTIRPRFVAGNLPARQ